MIIIPDVHGRSFWKEAIKKREDNEEIIFLGDYLDNYPGEFDPYTEKGITNKVALENFKEILDFARETEGVTLLLGNHDVEYLFDSCYPCRMDVSRKSEIEKLFNKNRDLFKVGIYYDDTIITHAGISPKFLKSIGQENTGFFNFIDYLNELWKNGNSELGFILGKVGWDRGGYDEEGSPVWIDWYSLQCTDNEPRQIVGHSQYDPRMGDNTYLRIFKRQACLDCRAAFRVNLYEWSFTPITKLQNVKYV